MNNKEGGSRECSWGSREGRFELSSTRGFCLQPSSLPRIQATSCMMSALNYFLQPKNSFSWLSHKEKNPTQCSAKFITRPLLPIEYLGQKRLEIYTPSPPPPIKDRKIGRFGFCAASSSTFLGGVRWGGGGARLACCSILFCPRL